MDKPFWPPENYYRVALKPLIFDEEGRLLLCQDAEGTWSMPGGGWDHDEDYESGMRREVTEELGAKVATIGPIAFFYRCTARHGQPKISLALPVTLQDFNFVMNPDDDEVVGVRFVTKQEFLELRFQDSEAPVQKYADQI